MLGGIVVAALALLPILWRMFENAQAEAQRQEAQATATAQAQATATAQALPLIIARTSEEILIPAGEFVMGSTEEEVDAALEMCNASYGDCERSWFADEQPQHTVYLDDYYIDKYEVTTARYQACVDAGACDAPQASSSDTRESYFGNPEYADYPVIKVTWFQAEAFCAWEGKRLPTEAEWEKAARGTDGRTYPWGNEAPDAGLLNYDENVGDTTPVGSYPAGASPYGALDMAGNVWEWVNDWYGEDYYRQSPRDNPPGPATGAYRVLRGGSWGGSDYDVRSARRINYFPVNWGYSSGFRCVRSQ